MPFPSLFLLWQRIRDDVDGRRPEESTTLSTFNQNWATVWIKMGSSWACIVLYLVSLTFRRRQRRTANVQRVRPAPVQREMLERETVT